MHFGKIFSKELKKASVMMPKHIPKVILQFWEKVKISIFETLYHVYGPWMMSDPICMLKVYAVGI